MITLALNLTILLSLGAIVYVLVRALPRVQEEVSEAEDLKMSRLLVYIEKADGKLKSFTEKLLRRMRIWVLKFENSISRKIKGFSEEKKKNAELNLGEEEKEEEKISK